MRFFWKTDFSLIPTKSFCFGCLLYSNYASDLEQEIYRLFYKLEQIGITKPGKSLEPSRASMVLLFCGNS